MRHGFGVDCDSARKAAVDLTGSKVPTRERLLRAARDLFQARGYHAVGLAEILSRAKAPKGSLYHHFPGGKPALAAAVITALADEMVTTFDRIAAREIPAETQIHRLFSGTADWVESNSFGSGGLLSVMSQEVVPDDAALTECLGRAHDRAITAFARALRAGGADGAQAGPILAMLDGAVAQARARLSRQPVEAAEQAALRLL